MGGTALTPVASGKWLVARDSHYAPLISPSLKPLVSLSLRERAGVRVVLIPPSQLTLPTSHP